MSRARPARAERLDHVRRPPGRCRDLGVAAMVGLVVLGTGGPAAAEAVAVADHRHDVWEAFYSDDGELLGWDEVGSRENTDIASTQVRHQPRKAVITTSFVSLRKDSAVLFPGLTHLMRLDDGTELAAAVTLDPMPAGTVVLQDPETGSVECDGLAHRVDYQSDTVLVTIPRRCLGWPDWLRVNTVARSEDSSNRFFKDVGDRPGHGAGGFTRRLSAG